MGAQKNRVLVVFIDAFGPEQLHRFGERLGFLPHRKALHGILGYSSGALPTILTGELPEKHGRMCLFAESPQGQTSILRPLRWLGLMPRLVHERARVRRVAEKLIAKNAKLEGYVALHKVPPELFSWLDMPERDDMFQARDIGGVTTFLADARLAGLAVYAAPWQSRESERWSNALTALQEQKPDLCFLYATELDGIMHREGPHGQQALAAMDRIAQKIERARELLADDGTELTTLVIGDHGMAQVNHYCDPRPMLRELPTMRLFVDSTMLRAWGNDAQLSALHAALDRHNFGGTWLQGPALSERAVPGNHAFGRAIYVLNEGAIFAPSFLGGRVNGMHGYDVHTSCAQAALASDQPIAPQTSSITQVASIVRQRLALA